MTWLSVRHAALNLLLEHETTHAHCRVLGLTKAAVDDVIREHSAKARETPYPLDWRTVRAALTKIAAPTPKEQHR